MIFIMKNYILLALNQNFYYTRGATPKRVTSGPARLLDLASGLHSSEETSPQCQAVDDTVSD